MARTKVEEPVLPPVIETPVLEAPVLPPTLETPPVIETPPEPVLPPAIETPVLGDGPFKVRHKVNGNEFEVSADYLAAYRETLELL